MTLSNMHTDVVQYTYQQLRDVFMKTTHCAACSITENLQHHHLVPRSLGGSDDETNLITLCEGCHDRAHGRLAVQHRKLTLDGMAQAKARGVRFGCPDPSKGNKAAIPVLKQRADDFAEGVRQYIEPMRGQPLRKIAKHLQDAGVKTRMGGDTWAASQVVNLMRRLYP